MTLCAPPRDLQRWLPNPQPSQRHLQPVSWVPVLGGQVKRDGGSQPLARPTIVILHEVLIKYWVRLHNVLSGRRPDRSLIRVEKL